MARVAIEDGFFTIPDDPAEPPRLLGSRCQALRRGLLPAPASCARSASTRAPTTSSSGPRGTLYTWTYVHVPLFAKKNAKVERLRRRPDRPARGPARPGDPRRRSRRLRDRHGARARPRGPRRRRGRQRHRDLPLQARGGTLAACVERRRSRRDREARGRRRRGGRDGAVRAVPGPQRARTWRGTRGSPRCTTPASRWPTSTRRSSATSSRSRCSA